MQKRTETRDRLKTTGTRLKKEKCSFNLSEVEYLGHCMSAEELKPSKSKVKAIVDAPVPSKVSVLKSFPGQVNYYGKFLPNLATALGPLYNILSRGSGPLNSKLLFRKLKNC